MLLTEDCFPEPQLQSEHGIDSSTVGSQPGTVRPGKVKARIYRRAWYKMVLNMGMLTK